VISFLGFENLIAACAAAAARVYLAVKRLIKRPPDDVE
jgi:hypothetical protein